MYSGSIGRYDDGTVVVGATVVVVDEAGATVVDVVGAVVDVVVGATVVVVVVDVVVVVVVDVGAVVVVVVGLGGGAAAASTLHGSTEATATTAANAPRSRRTPTPC